MHIGVFDLFKIGIGPSSSHTVGPMKAARRFMQHLAELSPELQAQVARFRVELYGSLGATGKGHGTDTALILGLMGETPENVAPERVPEILQAVRKAKQLGSSLWSQALAFEDADIVFKKRETLPLHANGMRFYALDAQGTALCEKVFYSVGGGFVVNEQGVADGVASEDSAIPHPFSSGEELLRLCAEQGFSVSTLMMRNECAGISEASVRERILGLAEAMQKCIERGCEQEGILPGGLKVKRRAASMFRRLRTETRGAADPLVIMDWVNLFALAVNEENAAGGRVVTAPTNGAAGIIPAVLEYYRRFTPNADHDGVVRFFLTAAAVGSLYKKNASISGAEVGCQGEVGVACSMAAAGLTEVLGGTPEQVENAAEIGMEHNLGLTCDPIGGLVQVPCIERNAMGAVKAINASRLALSGDGKHKVSLDKVIATMRETGRDMSTKYKETARGGLAVNIIEC